VHVTALKTNGAVGEALTAKAVGEALTAKAMRALRLTRHTLDRTPWA
jgi:hypothetical protein